MPSPGQAGLAAAGWGCPGTAPGGSADRWCRGNVALPQVRGWLRCPLGPGAVSRPGPEKRWSSTRPAARRARLATEPPQETGSLRVCARPCTWVWSGSRYQAVCGGKGKKKKKANLLPTFFFSFFSLLLPRALIPLCGQTALLL